MPALSVRLLVCVTLVTACATAQKGPQTAPTISYPNVVESVAPRFKPCEAETLRGLECASVRVPSDWNNKTVGHIDVAVAKLRASGERQGTLFVNPGGPGESAREFVKTARSVLSDQILKSFDIVGVDPRGVGGSAPLDCKIDYNTIFGLDPTPDTPQEEQALLGADSAWASACARAATLPLSAYSSAQSAKDLEAVRKALGETTFVYLGFSYGSDLGATYLSLFPTQKGRLVFDGAADPDASNIEASLQQGAGFEASLNTFFGWCDNSPERCPIAPRAATTFDQIIERLDMNPAAGDSSNVKVGQGVALLAVATGLYNQDFWPTLATALNDAGDGYGNGLLALYYKYLGRNSDGTFHRTQDAFRAINMADTAELTLSDQQQLLKEAKLSLKRFWPLFSVAVPHSDPWPDFARENRPAIQKASVASVVVLAATGDPATPLEATRRMAEALGAQLLIREGNGHTSYILSQCVRDLVDPFLLDAKMPETTKKC